MYGKYNKTYNDLQQNRFGFNVNYSSILFKHYLRRLFVIIWVEGNGKMLRCLSNLYFIRYSTTVMFSSSSLRRITNNQKYIIMLQTLILISGRLQIRHPGGRGTGSSYDRVQCYDHRARVFHCQKPFRRFRTDQRTRQTKLIQVRITCIQIRKRKSYMFFIE